MTRDLDVHHRHRSILGKTDVLVPLAHYLMAVLHCNCLRLAARASKLPPLHGPPSLSRGIHQSLQLGDVHLPAHLVIDIHIVPLLWHCQLGCYHVGPAGLCCESVHCGHIDIIIIQVTGTRPVTRASRFKRALKNNMTHDFYTTL